MQVHSWVTGEILWQQSPHTPRSMESKPHTQIFNSEKQKREGEPLLHQVVGSSGDSIHLGRTNCNTPGKERSLCFSTRDSCSDAGEGANGKAPQYRAGLHRERSSAPSCDFDRSSSPWWITAQRARWGLVCVSSGKKKERNQTSLLHFHLNHTEGALPPTCQPVRSAPFCCDHSPK